MTSETTSTAGTLRIEREFTFDRDVVFDAWTKPEILARWFAPRGCSVRFEHADIRGGGTLHTCISNPAFGDCWTLALFREVVRPERLVFDWRIVDAKGETVSPSSQGHDPEWPAEMRVVVKFTQRVGTTLVTLEQNVSEVLARKTGAYPSWISMFELLGEELAVRGVGDAT